MAAGLGTKHPDSEAALDLAYGDVRRAFEHYLRRHNSGRPIVLAGHSQGSLHLVRLLRDFFCADCPLRTNNQLVAAYLLGWTVFPSETSGLPVCAAANATGCVISWRTFERGGDPTAFLYVRPPVVVVKSGGGGREEKRDAADTGTAAEEVTREVPICVNPLTWTIDGRHADALGERTRREMNQSIATGSRPQAEGDGGLNYGGNYGSLDLMHPWTMIHYLWGRQIPWYHHSKDLPEVGWNGSDSKARVSVPPLLVPGIADAQCGEDGALYTRPPRAWGYRWGPFPSWQFAKFPGGNLHSYDYNLYFENIRRNVAERVGAVQASKKL